MWNIQLWDVKMLVMAELVSAEKRAITKIPLTELHLVVRNVLRLGWSIVFFLFQILRGTSIPDLV